MLYTVGIDLGGTNIAVGVVDENYNIIGKAKIKTESSRGADAVIADMAKAARLAIEDAGLTEKDITAIGIGCPGSINTETGEVYYSNNLDWKHVFLTEEIRKYIDLPTYIDNDANSAAYGEFLAGAGRGSKHFIAITLGTGVGSGIIVGGKIITGATYGGGELGHTVIVVDGAKCTCGRRGCYEAYASATGLIRQTKEKMLECKDSLMWQLCHNDINNVNGRTAYDGQRKNDKAADEVVNMYEKYVACGITNAMNIFEPDVICIGGGVSKEGDNILTPVLKYVDAERFGRINERKTAIKIAELGNDAGIIGAACLYKLHK